MIGTLQAHVMIERDGARVEPLACPLAYLRPAEQTDQLVCTRYTTVVEDVIQCAHLMALAESHDINKRVWLTTFVARASGRGARQIRCVVLCAAAKVPARPGVCP